MTVLTFEKLNAALDLKDRELHPEKLTSEELEECKELYNLCKEDEHLICKCEKIGISLAKQFVLKQESCGFGAETLAGYSQLKLRMPSHHAGYFEELTARNDGIMSMIVPSASCPGFPGIPNCYTVEERTKYKAYAEAFRVFHKNFRAWLGKELEDVSKPAEFTILRNKLNEKIGTTDMAEQPAAKTRSIEDAFLEEIVPLIEEDQELIEKCRQANMTFPKSILINGGIGLGVSTGKNPLFHLKDLALYTYDNKAKVEVYLAYWPKTELVWHSVPENYPASIFMFDYGPSPAPKAMYKQYVEGFKTFHKNFRSWLNSKLLGNKGENFVDSKKEK